MSNINTRLDTLDLCKFLDHRCSELSRTSVAAEIFGFDPALTQDLVHGTPDGGGVLAQAGVIQHVGG